MKWNRALIVGSHTYGVTRKCHWLSGSADAFEAQALLAAR